MSILSILIYQRDIYQKGINRWFGRLIVYLQILTFTWFVMLASLIGKSMHQEGKYSWKAFHNVLVLYLVVGALALIAVIMWARAVHQLVSKNNRLVAFFGIVVFFIGFLPTLIEGDAINMLDQISKKDIESICFRANAYTELKKLPDNIDNKYTRYLYELAHTHDKQTTLFLNEFMCSQKCPCYSPSESWLHNIDGIKMQRNDPAYLWSNLHEIYLNSHQRTKGADYEEKKFAPNLDKLIPLVFTIDNKKEGFTSLKECLYYWAERMEMDPSVQMEDIFRLKLKVDSNGPVEKNDYINAIKKYFQMDFIESIEEHMGCSGICQSGLFYFTRPTSQGYPTQTCLQGMRNYVQEQTSGLPTIFYLISATNFILFLFHFAFYDKQEMVGDMEGSKVQSPKGGSKFPVRESLGMTNRNLHQELDQTPRDISKSDINYNNEMVSISEIGIENNSQNTERLDKEKDKDEV